MTLKQKALNGTSGVLVVSIYPLAQEGQPLLAMCCFLAWLYVFITLWQDLGRPTAKKTLPAVKLSEPFQKMAVVVEPLTSPAHHVVMGKAPECTCADWGMMSCLSTCPREVWEQRQREAASAASYASANPNS